MKKRAKIVFFGEKEKNNKAIDADTQHFSKLHAIQSKFRSTLRMMPTATNKIPALF